MWTALAADEPDPTPDPALLRDLAWLERAEAIRVTWFDPQRPVNGTVFVRPEA